MTEVFYLHWNAPELAARVKSLADAGHKVTGHSSTTDHMKWPDGWLPDLMVISLDRLPSHGRAVAEWVWEAKKRQHIPILFCGGEPDKVAATKAKFPKAIYCATDAVAATIAKLPKATAPSEATRGLTKRRKSEKK